MHAKESEFNAQMRLEQSGCGYVAHLQSLGNEAVMGRYPGLARQPLWSNKAPLEQREAIVLKIQGGRHLRNDVRV